MAFKLNFRGPRLGTKLALMGLALLVVPWFSYLQLVEMERLLIQGQSQAQLLTAEGISTLFNGREDLFNDLPVALEDFEPLYAQPLENTIRLDGSADDWGQTDDRNYLQFGTSSGNQDADFTLMLGERSDYLYAHMRVQDNRLVYRDPDYLRLDNADHIRLNFIGADGRDGRMSLVFDPSDVVTGFSMDEQWRYAATGSADNRIQGVLRRVEGMNAVVLEFRIPLSLLGSRQYFGLTYVDVDDELQRDILRVTQTLPPEATQSFNLVVLRTPEVRNIVQGLGYSGAKIVVIDNQRRVRAEVGATRLAAVEDDSSTQMGSLTRQLTRVGDFIRRFFVSLSGEPVAPDGVGGDAGEAEDESPSDRAIRLSLQGDPIALRNPLVSGEEIILAAHPIVSSDQVIGTVIVEQNIDDILRFQRTALEQVLLLSLLSLFAIFLALIAFAGRLAWRIRNLRREASAAIDVRGRLRRGGLLNEMNAGDEIGDLARSVSNMLEKLKQHNSFLENMPRTLRHEINNPLNTLSTSLQNLADEHPGIDDSKYLESAKRGVNRIGSIVQNLADAANLEEALEAEELENIDLNELLASYVANCGSSHVGVSFQYKGSPAPVHALVSDFRIEQMLDKLIDNAVDFHRVGTPIRVQLECYGDPLQIVVANRGAALSEERLHTIFDSMVSHRGPDNRLHFGLGLHVVRIIAEHHGGTVSAINLADASGVAFVVRLPMANSLGDRMGDQAPILTAER
ncbi:ATP-binding protein [Gammaproteobacteria bacterium]|nr:ATP-binding protein [Gammaproteobacteria bacterium]